MRELHTHAALDELFPSSEDAIPEPTLTIRTNGHYRPVLCWENLTVKEQAEFDSGLFYDSSFFRYRGWVYTLDDFMRVDGSPFYGWDGYHGESFFSGVLVKYSSCGEYIKVASYFS